MLSEYKRGTNIGVGVGWIVMIIGNVMMRSGTFINVSLGSIVFLIGTVCFVWGCVQYAKGKGHSGYWGALGLLWLFGLLVLFFLPDRHKVAKA